MGKKSKDIIDFSELHNGSLFGSGLPSGFANSVGFSATHWQGQTNQSNTSTPTIATAATSTTTTSPTNNAPVELAKLNPNGSTPLGLQIAQVAEQKALQKNTVGLCSQGTRETLTALGVKGLEKGNAHTLRQQLDRIAEQPNSYLVKVSPKDFKPGDIFALPPSGQKPDGHIGFVLPGNREASDHVQPLIVTSGSKETGTGRYRYGADIGAYRFIRTPGS